MNNSKKLYDALSKDYDLGSYDKFVSDIADESKRRKLYDAIIEEYDMGDYNSFSSQLGYPSTSSAPSAEEIQEEMKPEEKRGFLERLGSMPHATAAGAVINPNATAEAPIELTDEQKQAQAEMRQHLQETGVIDSMEDAQKEARKAKRQAALRMFGANTLLAEGIVNDEVVELQKEQAREYSQNKLMQNTLGEALDMVKQGERNLDGSWAVGDFAHGVWDEATRLATWDMGYSDVVNGLTLNQLTEKWQNDHESLTATEKKVIDALAQTAAVEQAYAGTTGIGYAVGQSMPHSAAFMVQMGINPASGLGEALAAKAVKNIGKQGVQKAAKGGIQLLTEALEVGVMTGTVGAGRVAADALERINGSSEYTITPDGYIQYGGQSDNEEVSKAWWKAFGSSFIEGYTESLGKVVFDPALGALQGVVGGKVKAGAVDELGAAMLGEKPSRLAEAMRAIKKIGKVDSMVGELLEEEVGMIMNALTVGDQSFDPNDPNYVFNLENQLTTLISTCLMTGALSAVEAAGDHAKRREVNKAADNADKMGRAMYGEGWDAIRDQIDGSTPQEAVDMVKGIMLDPTVDKQKKDAILNYASKRITAQYFNAEDEAVREELVKERQDMFDAFDAGYNSRLPEFYNMRKAVDNAKQALEDYGNETGRMDAIVAALHGISEAPERMGEILYGMNKDEQQLIKDYFYSRTRMNGAYVGRSDKLEDYVDEYAYALEPFVVNDGQGNRTITSANVYRNGADIPVYVLQNDGTNAFIMSEDGTSEMVLVKELENVVTRNADDVIEVFRQQATQQMEAETEKAETYPEEVKEPQVGLQISTREGKQWVVKAVDGDNVSLQEAAFDNKSGEWVPSGEPKTMPYQQFMDWQMAEHEKVKEDTYEQGEDLTFYVKGTPIGARVNSISPDGKYLVQIENLIDGLDKSIVDEYDADELRKLTTIPTAKAAESNNVSANQPQNEGTPTEQIEQSVSEEVTDGQIDDNVTKPTAEVVKSVNTPQTKAAELLVELEADEVDENIAYNAQKALDEAEAKRKSKPTMKDADGDVATFKALKAQWEAELNEAQKNVLYWDEVAKEVANQRAAEPEYMLRESDSQAEQTLPPLKWKRPKRAKREPVSFEGLGEAAMEVANEIRKDTTPQNGEELAAAMMAKGGHKIIPASFREHTGYSTTEQKTFVGLFSNSGVTLERLGELVMQADREDGTNFFDQNDANAGLNAVLEVLSQAETMGDINNYIQQNRDEVAYREAWAVENAEREQIKAMQDAWYMEQYHATEEELRAYNEWLGEINEENLPSEEDIQEVYSIFAEQQLEEYDNERTDAGLPRAADSREGQEAAPYGDNAVGTAEQAGITGEAESTPDGRTAEGNAQADEDVREESNVITTNEENYGTERDNSSDGRRQERVSPTATRQMDKNAARRVRDFEQQTGWTSRLTAKEREIVEGLRLLTDEEIAATRREALDKLKAGRNASEARTVLSAIRQYEASGESQYLIEQSGITPNEPVSLEKIEELFISYNSDEDLAELFSRVLPLIKQINPKITFENIEDPTGVVVGDYTIRDNHIRYNINSITSAFQTSQGKASTIVHEMIHAVAQYAISANERGMEMPKKLSDAAKSLVNIYNAIKDNDIFLTDEVDENGQPIRDYGVTDVYEMISELAKPAFREKLKQIEVKGKNVWEQIKDIFKRLVNVFADVYDVSAYAKAVDALDALLDNYNEELFDKIASVSDGSAVASIKTYRDGGRKILEEFINNRVKAKDLTTDEGVDIMQQMDAIYDLCQQYKDVYAPFSEWSEAEVVVDKQGKPVFSVIKSNGDYVMNLDFSLVCKKRRTLDAVLQEMISRGIINNYQMGGVDIAKINEIIRDYGFETACRLCFVDAKRFRVVDVADSFVELYNELADMSEVQLKKVIKQEKKKSVRKKAAQHILEHPEDKKHLDRSQFITSQGFEDVKVNNEAILKLYNAAKGSGGPKASFGDVQYLNDVIKTTWKPEAAYAVGGVRIQSFSDYVPRLVLDYVQMMADLAAKKMPAHAYTKEELFAKQFGLTGVKINLSLVPRVDEDGVAAGLDKDGNYAWQDGESFPYEEAVAIQNAEGYRENCGTIAVGVSDAQIEKMLDDENIRMVIPYHKSGLNPLVAKYNKIDAFTDYTKVQNTRYANGKALEGKDKAKVPDFNALMHEGRNAREAAQAYLDWCDENGYLPKFDQWRNHPNYYKLLEDFTTIVPNNGVEEHYPQREVRMQYPTAENAFGDMNSLIQRGLEEDAVLEGRRTEKVDEIVDEIVRVLDNPVDYSEENLRFRDGNNAELKEKYTDEQIFDAAKQKFGVTDDIREAGYILPDGTMLDFSGRSFVDDKKNFKGGTRSEDHRAISQIGYDANDNETGLETNMTDFIERGAIRIHVDSNGKVGMINLDAAPTKEQKSKLRQLIAMHNGSVDVDFGNGWDTDHHAEYDNAAPARVFGDIDRYYSDGVRPEGNAKYRDGEGEISDKEVSYQNDPIAKWQGKPRYTGKKAAAFAERERKRMKQAVSEVSEALGLNVTIVEDAQSIPVERRRRAKGWYNTRTGEIVVVIPNHVSAWDAVQTVLHEGIAHHGLRNLFGDKLDVVLDNIYNNVAPELKAKIDAIAAERGLDTRTATEEYLASLAEDTNFEEAVKQGWWAKIKSWFAKMFSELTENDASFFEQFTDNELRYILWSSYRKMTQRTHTPMSMLEDAQMQHDLQVGNYAPATMVAEPYEHVLEDVNEVFNEQLEALNEENGRSVILSLGFPSEVLVSSGIENMPIRLYGSKLIAKAKKHGYKVTDIKNLPKALQHPIAIFKGSREGSHAVLTQLSINGKNVLVSLSVGKGGHDVDFNIISSVYGKNEVSVVRWINEGKLRFVDKEKALNYLSVSAPIAEAQDNQELDSATKVINDFVNPSIEDIKDVNDEKILHREEAVPFYSNAERAVENIKQNKATPEQWLAMIKKDGGLKAGEDKWMGLSDWLNEQKEKGVKTLTKDEVLAFIRENQIEIEEVEYEGEREMFTDKDIYDTDEFTNLLYELVEINDDGESSVNMDLYEKYLFSNPHFAKAFEVNFYRDSIDVISPKEAAIYLGLENPNTINSTRLDYTTEGLDNKKEIAFVVPSIESWNRNDEIHFGDAGDGRAVAWVRFGETTDEDGNRVLVIDEVQSKRHDEGRAKGYKPSKEDVIKATEAFQSFNRAMREKYGDKPAWEWSEEEQAELNKLTREHREASKNYDRGIPDAPFDKNYHELAMKRMLRYAAENGFDKVAWNTGKQVAQRFGLSSRVSSIEYKPLANGHYNVTAYGTNGYPIEGVPVVYNNEQEIAETFGRSVAEKIVKDIDESKKTLKETNDALRELKERRKDLDEDSEEYEEIMEEYARLFALQDEANSAKSIEGDGLSIGGDDRVALYDEMIPRFMDKYTKKWGTKVGEVTLPNVEEDARTMWSVDVTPEMKESVMQGQPMFRTAEVVNEGEYLTEDKLNDIVKEASALGVNVRVANDVNELDERVRKDIESGRPVKGYYDTRTGEVVVYAPYATSTNDVKRTILHEVVGHKGLRKLLGDDDFNKMMVQMYQMLPEEERKKVWDSAIRKYGDLAEAMEEYFAEKAESLEKPKWWQKVLTTVKMWLHNKFGVRLTDADINYILWRSKQRLASDTAMDMAVNATLYRAAKQSGLTDAEIKELEEAEMRLFEKSQRARYLRGRTGDAAREYENAVNTTQYRSTEAFRDSMRGLKVLQEAIAKESGKEIRDFENPYMAENRMSSINLRDMEMYKKNEYNKLLKAISDLMTLGASYEEITDYMMAKHGLERNEVFARRDAAKDARDMYAKLAELLSKEPTAEQIVTISRIVKHIESSGIDTTIEDGKEKKWFKSNKGALERLLNDATRQEIEDGLYDKNRKADYAGLTALTGESKVKDAERTAQQMVDEFEGKYPVQRLWVRTRICNQKTLEITYNAGLINKETYEELKDQFVYYIPLRGFDETTAEDVYFYVGGKDSPYNAPIKAARGRKSKADDPIATIGSMAESAITDANRNRVKMEFYNMAVNHKTDLISISDVWMAYDAATGSWVAQFPDIPNDATPEEVKAEMEAFEARMEAQAAANPNLYAKASEKPHIPYRVVKKADMNEHQVIVKKNGRDVVMTINGNPRAAQAINGLTNPEARDEWYNKAFAWVNRNLSANFTTRNPAFVISNLVRDGIYTNSMVHIKESPLYAKTYHKNFFKAMVKISSLVSKYKQYEAGDTFEIDMNDPMQRMFVEFMTNGGETGYTAMNSVDDYKRMSKKELKKMLRKGALATGEKVVDFLAEGFDTFGRWAEGTSRFAAYMTSRQMGRSIARSIYDAKEISVNFNKKGAGSKMRGKFADDPMAWLSSTVSQGGRNLYVFWNAGVQGLTNFGRAAVENKGKFTIMAMAAMAAGVLIPVIFSSDDDDDDEYYLLPEYVRRNNICFKVGKKQFLTLPLPIEMRALYGMGELAYSFLSGKEELTAGELTTKIIQQMSQVMPIDMMADGGGLKALIPSAIKPVAEAAMNVNWTGEPIYKEETVFNENYPTWMLSYKSTSPELVWLSRQINEATNENAKSGAERTYDRGWADNRFFNNPAVWEHIWEGYLGGIGTITNQTKKTLMMPFDEDLREVRNIPVVSRFVKAAGDRAKEYTLNEEYYGALDVADKLGDEVSAYKREARDANNPNREEMLKIYTEMAEEVNNVTAVTNKLKKKVKELESLQKSNPDEVLDFNDKETPIKEVILALKQQVIETVGSYMND